WRLCGCFFQAEDGIRDRNVTGVQTCALPIWLVEPEGAFYAFFSYDVDVPSSQVASELAELGVLVRAGAEYGPDAEHHIRLSFAASQSDIERGIGLIRTYFEGF